MKLKKSESLFFEIKFIEHIYFVRKLRAFHHFPQELHVLKALKSKILPCKDSTKSFEAQQTHSSQCLKEKVTPTSIFFLSSPIKILY